MGPFSSLSGQFKSRPRRGVSRRDGRPEPHRRRPNRGRTSLSAGLRPRWDGMNHRLYHQRPAGAAGTFQERRARQRGRSSSEGRPRPNGVSRRRGRLTLGRNTSSRPHRALRAFRGRKRGLGNPHPNWPRRTLSSLSSRRQGLALTAVFPVNSMGRAILDHLVSAAAQPSPSCQ